MQDYTFTDNLFISTGQTGTGIYVADGTGWPDNAAVSYTHLVAPGTYAENVIVNKKITLDLSLIHI